MNLNILLAGIGRAAALRIACVESHTARSAPCIPSQSSGQISKLFPHEPLHPISQIDDAGQFFKRGRAVQHALHAVVGQRREALQQRP